MQLKTGVLCQVYEESPTLISHFSTGTKEFSKVLVEFRERCPLKFSLFQQGSIRPFDKPPEQFLPRFPFAFD